MHTTLLQRTCALGAAAIVLWAPTVARAVEPSPDAMEQSSALYQQARALQVRAKWAEAEAAYQAAWELRHTFDIAGNLGDCELHVGQPREAAEHLSYALKNVPAGVLPEQSSALKRMLKEAQAQIGTLRVTVNVAGAHVFVDGRAVDDPAGEVFVDPGTRTIEARVTGYSPAQQTLEVRAGTSERVELTLAAIRRSVVPGAILGGVAGAALVTGIGVFAAGRAKASTAQGVYEMISRAGNSCVTGASNDDPRCGGLQSTASTSNTLQRAGVGLWIGAGATAAAALLYFTLPSPSSGKPSDGALRVAPTASSGAAGLVFSGTF
jgi:PEGA domain